MLPPAIQRAQCCLSTSAPGLMTRGLIKTNCSRHIKAGSTCCGPDPSLASLYRFQTQLRSISISDGHSEPPAQTQVSQKSNQSAGFGVKVDLCFISQSQTSNGLYAGSLARPKAAIKYRRGKKAKTSNEEVSAGAKMLPVVKIISSFQALGSGFGI